MSNIELIKTRSSQNFMLGAETSKGQSTIERDDDFSKIFSDKKAEKELSKRSTDKSEDKKEVSEKKESNSSKVEENETTENKEKKTETENEERVIEDEDKVIRNEGKSVEDEDKMVEGENIGKLIEIKDSLIDGAGKIAEGEDENMENSLSELNFLIEDLINTLQSSNIIDKDELQQIISNFEKSDLNLDQLKSLIDDLEMIGKSATDLNIDDKLIKISNLLEELKISSTNENVEQFLNSSKLINAEEENSAEEVQNLKEFSVNEEKAASGEITEKKGEQENSLEYSNKDDQSFITKKGINNETSKENDFDFLSIKNAQIDDHRGYDAIGLNKALDNIAKPDMKIFNQVIESAKINISEDVSEMVIKMKPDNLGKLSMKIVVERGIVVARFDVESQIVKEAIESNLEDLRNALKDKGFEIQQFDVSVNKDSDNSENYFSYFNKGKSKKKSIGNEFIVQDVYAASHQTIDGLSSTIDYLG